MGRGATPRRPRAARAPSGKFVGPGRPDAGSPANRRAPQKGPSGTRDEARSHERARFPMLRQQWEREGQKSFRSLADYVAPVESGLRDYLGAFAVTAGVGADELAAAFEAKHDPYNGIMVKALADRLAE